MQGNEHPSLPRFDSVQGAVEFFDTHDMGEYLDQMPEAQFEVAIKHRRFLIAIDEELMNKLAEIAKAQHVSTESLIDSWLREKALNAA